VNLGSGAGFTPSPFLSWRVIIFANKRNLCVFYAAGRLLSSLFFHPIVVIFSFSLRILLECPCLLKLAYWFSPFPFGIDYYLISCF
jgi:hypothetical protein